MKVPLNTSQFPVQKELGSKVAARGRKWFASVLSLLSRFFHFRGAHHHLVSKALEEPLVQSVPQNTLQFNNQREEETQMSGTIVSWIDSYFKSPRSIVGFCVHLLPSLWSVMCGNFRRRRTLLGGDPWRARQQRMRLTMANRCFFGWEWPFCKGSHYSHHRQLASSLHDGEYPQRSPLAECLLWERRFTIITY